MQDQKDTQQAVKCDIIKSGFEPSWDLMAHAVLFKFLNNGICAKDKSACLFN